MTTASDIITRAYRESQIIPLVSTPNSNEQNEALPLLNSLILSCVGFDVGTELRDLNVGGQWDESQCVEPWIPIDARLIFNLSDALTLGLDPQPYEGQRWAYADVAGNLATYNVTISGNGRSVAGSTSLVLNTNGATGQYLYRADTANWVSLGALGLNDAMPFPTAYDDYFIIGLALRLNPRNGVALSKESMATYQRIGNAISARYRKPRRPNEPLLGLLHQKRGYYSESNAAFNFGRP